MKEADSQEPPLPDEIQWLLEKADGFLDLKMRARAAAEIKRIPAVYHDTDPCLRIFLRMAMDSQDWGAAAHLSKQLLDRHPALPDYWINLAYATRRATGIEAARAILREAAAQFPKFALIPFNLACYACCLGQHDEARKLLKQAIRMDPTYQGMAQEDEDLAPLWPELGD